MNQESQPNNEHQQTVHFEWRFLAPQFWLLWLWFGLLWLVSRLPYPLFCRIGEGLGLLAMKFGTKRKYFAERNVELCFPELSKAERDVIVRNSFKGAGMALFESGLVWWPKKGTSAMCEIHGLEHLEQARKAGDNIMLFAPHITSLEVCFSFLSQFVPFNVLFRVHDNPLWEFMATHGRRHYDLRLIPRKRVKDFLHYMNHGEPGLIAADQDMGKKRSLFVPFFGIPAATIPSIQSFAQQANAKTFFISAHRRERKGYTVTVSPALENFPSDNIENDCTRTNGMVEEFVRKHPGDYLWHHRRFKTRPPGEPALYDRKKK